MTKIITISLNNAEGKAEKFQSDGLSVRNTIAFYELQDEIIKKAQSEESISAMEGLQRRIEFLASIFDGVNEDMIIDGMEPDVFEKEWIRIMTIIAPQEFGVDEGK